MDPTFDGFVDWVTNVMGVPASVMPNTATLQYAFDLAMSVAYTGLQTIPTNQTVNVPFVPSPSIYAYAVYNLGGDYLVRIAQDDPTAQPPPDNATTYWSDLRTTLNINSFTTGLVTSAHDQGTSETTMIPKSVQNMTLGNLMLLQTPWGRTYLGIVSSWGTLWGLTR
jgi:hypothetical protein